MCGGNRRGRADGRRGILCGYGRPAPAGGCARDGDFRRCRRYRGGRRREIGAFGKSWEIGAFGRRGRGRRGRRAPTLRRRGGAGGSGRPRTRVRATRRLRSCEVWLPRPLRQGLEHGCGGIGMGRRMHSPKLRRRDRQGQGHAYGCRGVGGIPGRAWAWWLGETCGQSTLEYALVLMAFLSMMAALGLVWHSARDGTLVRVATDAAAHQASGGAVPWLQDLLGF